MPRSVVEWVGKNDDTPIPPRVKARVLERFFYTCTECFLHPLSGVNRPEFDHEKALINGGENRESNIRLLCRRCHGLKTKADVAEKSKVSRIRKKHLGLTRPKRKIPSRPFPKREATP